MKPINTLLLGWCLLVLSLIACNKPAVEQVIPTEDYEMVFHYEADEDIDRFVGEVSVDGRTWLDTAGFIWPLPGTSEYIIPVRLEKGQQYYLRVRGETTAGTIYYSAVAAVSL